MFRRHERSSRTEQKRRRVPNNDAFPVLKTQVEIDMEQLFDHDTADKTQKQVDDLLPAPHDVRCDA